MWAFARRSAEFSAAQQSLKANPFPTLQSPDPTLNKILSTNVGSYVGDVADGNYITVQVTGDRVCSGPKRTPLAPLLFTNSGSGNGFLNPPAADFDGVLFSPPFTPSGTSAWVWNLKPQIQ